MIKIALIPWTFYSICSMIYFAEVLSPNSGSYKEFDLWDILGLFVILLTLYQLYIEYRAIRSEPKGYLKSAYNYNDLF